MPYTSLDEKFEKEFVEDKSGCNSVGLQYIDAPETKLKSFIHSAIDEARLAGKEDEKRRIVEMIEGMKKEIKLEATVYNPIDCDPACVSGYNQALLDLKQSIIK